jgi:hypothetical protein
MPLYPKAILIVVFSLVVAGSLLIWGGIFTLLKASSSGDKIEPLVLYMSVVVFLLGVVSLIAAWSLLRGKHWARLFVIIFAFVSIAISILSLSVSNFGSTVTLFIYGYIAFLMMTRNAKVYFQ